MGLSKKIVRAAKRLAKKEPAKKPLTAKSRSQDKERPAVSLVEHEGAKYELRDGSFILADGRGLSGDVVIPPRVSGRDVSGVARRAFADNTQVSSVVFPENASILGSSAFEGCSSLISVELPVYLEVINARAFAGCSSLTEVILPAKLKRICSEAFEGCSGLRDIPHKVLGGVSSTAFVTDDMEDHLPTDLEYIGKRAFFGCESLERVAIPHSVQLIRTETFAGCASLYEITFHTQLKRIMTEAFARCSSLSRVRLPESLSEIQSGAFDVTCTLVVEPGSTGESYANKFNNPLVVVPDSVNVACSKMVPVQNDAPIHTPFYSEEELCNAEQAYQVRTPIDYRTRGEQEYPVSPSRYVLNGDTYVLQGDAESKAGSADIVMVGDLMCRFAQQRFAKNGDRFDFNFEFDGVRDIIQSSDLAIGNMESLVSSSSPYMSESRYVEDRPHLNSPDSYLSAVRAAGFDIVVNAQNHIYDAGLRGIYETLDALNRFQLMHVGAYASDSDKHFLLLEVHGIKIGVVAFMDQARQKMKRVNYTRLGLETLFSPFERSRVERDISDARAAGAEFVIAYCHWGREYTERITNRQERFAKMVADAGADYIMGSHSHCPQPRTVIKSADGRDVPCVYSGGNFISDITIELPVTRDTFINKLTLVRDDDGLVSIGSESYIPCRIVQTAKSPGSVMVKTCESMAKSDDLALRYEGEEAALRIGYSLGMTARSEYMPPVIADGMLENRTQNEDLVLSPAFARIETSDSVDAVGRFAMQGANEFTAIRDSSVNEVRIACLGRFEYDAKLEHAADFDHDFIFKPSLKKTLDCTNGNDLVVAALTCSCSDEVPTSGLLPQGHISNCRKEYLDALKYAGVDCLAAANYYAYDGGVNSPTNTASAIRQAGMVHAGIADAPSALFKVNGISVAVLSYSQDCSKVRNTMTQRSWTDSIRVYDRESFECDVRDVRARGAEFILVYLDCSNGKQGVSIPTCTRIMHQMAEAGADYVVGLRPHAPRGYERFQTTDGRIVPIILSLGTYMSGEIDDASRVAAIANLSVRKDENGNVYVKDCYIPMKRFEEYRGAQNVTAAAMKYYNSDFNIDDFKRVKTTLASNLGDGIGVDPSRRIKMKTHCHGQLSIRQICEISGTSLSERDIARLGDNYDKPVRRIVTRRQDLSKGCVAIIFKTKPERRFTAVEAERAGALLVIGKERAGNVPFLCVDNPYQLFKRIMSDIRDKYQPIVVAITGTMGKSTTKELTYGAFQQHFNTLCIEGNNNTLNTSSLIMQKLTASDGAYVQEVHEGSPGSAQAISEFIKPHICIITAIAEGHLEQLGTMDNVINEIMSVTYGMDENGLLVLNDDNAYLHEQHPNCRTVRVSAHNAECDYYAKDIVETADQLRFTACCKDGEYQVLLNMPGLHNVNNALAVFAAGREAGIPPYEIISGMGHYMPSLSEHRANRQRQNLVCHGGYQLLIDCYNSSPQALASSAETMSRISIPKGARRIAVLADMAEQGEDEVSIHYEAGVSLAHSGIDCFLCYGPLSAHMAEGIRSEGGKAYHFEYRDAFNRALASIVRPGDAILFKGSHSFELYDQTVVPVFGDIA